MKKMTLVFAHPDDESFTCGGVVAKYAKTGWDIHLVCATRGEVGEHGPYDPNLSNAQIGEIRQKELEEAGKVLGLAKITFLGYKDGTLREQHAGELEDKIFRILGDDKPDVVVTFDPDGITNHPDHIKLSTATTYAFQKYAEGLVDPKFRGIRGVNVTVKKHEYLRSLEESEEKENLEPKLYYTVVPQSVVTYLQKIKAFPLESFGKPVYGVADRKVTNVIDVSKFRSAKRQALDMHKTQEKDVGNFYRVDNQPLTEKEYFVLRMQGEYEVYMGKNDTISNRL